MTIDYCLIVLIFIDSELAYVADFNNPAIYAANYKIEPYPATGWTQEYARKALRTEMHLEKAMECERFFDLVRWLGYSQGNYDFSGGIYVQNHGYPAF